MGTTFEVYMVAPFRHVGAAVERIIKHFQALGMVLGDSVSSTSESEEQVPWNPGWVDIVNTWPGAVFSAHRCGPSLNIAIETTDMRVLSVNVSFSHRALERLFSTRTERGCYYAPLVQIARALDVRFALGEVELEFEPKSEEQIAQAIWEGPSRSGEPSWLALVSQDALSHTDIVAKASSAFEITEWLSGYWMLEHRDYLAFYHRQ